MTPNQENTYTDFLINTHQDLWNKSIHHPLYNAMGDGTLHPKAMGLYLVQDYLFFDDFLKLTGGIIAHAPTIDITLKFGQYIGYLSSNEDTYFQDSFTALNITPPNVSGGDNTLIPAMVDFRKTISHAIQSGDYRMMMVCYMVFELGYLQWAQAQNITTDTPHFKDWIDMHRSPLFTDYVHMFVSLLNDCGIADGETLAKEQHIFAACLQHEIDFCDAVWQCHLEAM